MAIERLSAIKVDKTKRPGMYCDGAGLYLKVTESGSKSWIFRYRVGPRLRDHGLGVTHTYSLAEARELARGCRQLLQQGIDPIEHHRAKHAANRAAEAHVATFEACAIAYMGIRENKWRNGKSLEQWQQSLRTYAYPILGNMPIGLIDTPHLMRVLNPIWTTKTVTADRVRSRIEMILDYARVHGFRTGDNPARWQGHLEHLLHAGSKVEHHEALAYSDVPELMAKLRSRGDVVARSLEFLTLTAARLSEVRLAVWSEVDLGAKVWTVPGARMKTALEHRVPLSARTLEILEAVPADQRKDYLFPGRNGPIGENAMPRLLNRLAGDVTLHGMRSSFRTWAAECTSCPGEIAEAALAHIVSSQVEAAYKRTDFFDRRRELMNVWAGHCAGTGGDANVVKFRSA